MIAAGAKAKATTKTEEELDDQWGDQSYKQKQAKEAADRKKLAEREAKEAELTKKEDTKTKPKIEPQVSTSQDTPKPLEQANKPEKSALSK